MTKKLLWIISAAVIVAVLAFALFGYLRLQVDESNTDKSVLNDSRSMFSTYVPSTSEAATPPIQIRPVDAIYLEEIRLLAKLGNSRAQTILGVRYQYGLGVPATPRLMLENYLASAQQGDPHAALMLGWLYDTSSATPHINFQQKGDNSVLSAADGTVLLTQDDAKAEQWYTQSAIKGDVAAMVMLGHLLQQDIRQNPNNAADSTKWFGMAAEKGDVIAEEQFGEMYVTGSGIVQDEDKGIEWLKKAAAQGSVEAEFDLGSEYETGSAMTRNDSDAAKWYLLAAKHGNPYAQRDIGIFYAKGVGVPRDYVQAYIWLNLAAAKGAPSAAKDRDALESRMTKEQLEEAQSKSLHSI